MIKLLSSFILSFWLQQFLKLFLNLVGFHRICHQILLAPERIDKIFLARQKGKQRNQLVAEESLQTFIIGDIFLLDRTQAFGDWGLELASSIDIFLEFGLILECFYFDFFDKLLPDVLDWEHIHFVNEVDLIILEAPAFNETIEFILFLLIIVAVLGFGLGSVVIGWLGGVGAENVGRERKRPLIHLFILILNHNAKIINFIRAILISINNIINYSICTQSLTCEFVPSPTPLLSSVGFPAPSQNNKTKKSPQN